MWQPPRHCQWLRAGRQTECVFDCVFDWMGEASSTRWGRPCLSHWFSRQGSMGKRQTANPGWARIFFYFRQEHDASAFGMWGPKNSRTTTKCDKLRQTTTKMIRKCKKFLRSCKNLHKAPGALCWVHPLRFWLQIFGLPPFGGWMKVRYGKDMASYGKLWQVMVRLGWKWWWKCSRKI